MREIEIELRNVDNPVYFIIVMIIWGICFFTTISWVMAYITWDFRFMENTIRASIFYVILFFLFFKITRW